MTAWVRKVTLLGHEVNLVVEDRLVLQLLNVVRAHCKVILGDQGIGHCLKLALKGLMHLRLPRPWGSYLLH